MTEFTFGEFIRAARLGYRWATNVGKGGCYMRLSVLGPDRFSVQLAGRGHVKDRRNAPEEHVVWWERPADAPSLVDASPALRELADQEITGYVQMIVDDEGRRVR